MRRDHAVIATERWALRLVPCVCLLPTPTPPLPRRCRKTHGRVEFSRCREARLPCARSRGWTTHILDVAGTYAWSAAKLLIASCPPGAPGGRVSCCFSARKCEGNICDVSTFSQLWAWIIMQMYIMAIVKDACDAEGRVNEIEGEWLYGFMALVVLQFTKSF